MSTEKKKEKKSKPVKKDQGIVRPASGSREARKAVSMILEVLAGTLYPAEAAASLGISTPRYYVLESRAIDAMVTACEPKPPGYAKTAERELEALRKEYSRLQRECARYQALARAAHRTVGVLLPRKPRAGKKRKPTVRGLRLARLRLGDEQQAEPVVEPAQQEDTKENAAQP